MIIHYPDDHFGTFYWHSQLEYWFVDISFPRHDSVRFSPPLEYFELEDVRTHIRAVMAEIVRQEQNFRETAVDEMQKEDWYQLYWPEDQPIEPESSSVRCI